MKFQIRLVLIVGSLMVFSLGCQLLSPRPAWKKAPPIPVENAIVSSEDLHRITLENGVQLLLLEDHQLQGLLSD